MKIKITILFFFLLLMFCKSNNEVGKSNDSVETENFVWLPDSIKVEIKVDNEFKKCGKYLFLRQHLPEGSFGWLTMDFDIPEYWDITKMGFSNDSLLITTQDNGRFYLNPDNQGDLSFEILNSGTISDNKLNELWNLHAKF